MPVGGSPAGSPTALAIGIAGTFALLWARWQALELVPFAWGAIGVALVLAAVAAWFQSRPRFESVASARVLLEERLGLHARLSSAAAGVGEREAGGRAADEADDAAVAAVLRIVTI